MGMLESFKGVIDVVRKMDNIDLLQKIVVLQSEVAEVAEENRTLKAELKEMRGKLAFANNLTFKAPFYFNEGKGEPYCSRCWDVEHMAVHVVRFSGLIWRCPNCKADFPDHGQVAPK